MNPHSTFPRPAQHAENEIIDAILRGQYPIGSTLPGERTLAALLGVTRPTLREALQRLARDGWLEIHHGKATRVRNYWQEGSLGVLGALAERPWALPPTFIENLLLVRKALAPYYVRLAVEQEAQAVAELLEPYITLPGPKQGDPADEQAVQRYASFDWEVHFSLTILSHNPICTMILRGFAPLYPTIASIYFRSATARANARSFYAGLFSAAQANNADIAEAITRRAMAVSLSLWRATSSEWKAPFKKENKHAPLERLGG